MPISWGPEPGMAMACPVCGSSLQMHAALTGDARHQQSVGVQTVGCGHWLYSWWQSWNFSDRRRPNLPPAQLYGKEHSRLFGRAWGGAALAGTVADAAVPAEGAQPAGEHPR